LKLGNAGGEKDPDFWCAFEDGEVTVIGDEPANTNYDPGPSEKAVSKDEGGKLAAPTTLVAPVFLRESAALSRRTPKADIGYFSTMTPRLERLTLRARRRGPNS
jgi:hypothetical protein